MELFDNPAFIPLMLSVLVSIVGVLFSQKIVEGWEKLFKKSHK
jgi:hypothetical protein